LGFYFVLSATQWGASHISSQNLAFGQLTKEYLKVPVSSVRLEDSNHPCSETKAISAPIDYCFTTWRWSDYTVALNAN